MSCGNILIKSYCGNYPQINPCNCRTNSKLSPVCLLSPLIKGSVEKTLYFLLSVICHKSRNIVEISNHKKLCPWKVLIFSHVCQKRHRYCLRKFSTTYIELYTYM